MVAANCGGNSSYTIDSAGVLHAWGDNSFGQLGISSLAATSVPVVVPVPAGATAWTFIAPGERHCVALANDGFLYAWGDHTQGQLGTGDLPQPESRVPLKVPFPPEVTRWRTLASGSFHSLAVSDQGRLYVWGDNRFGQLGLGSTNPVNRPTLVDFPVGVTAWVSLAAGKYHSLAVADNQLLFAWGNGAWGQLGVPLPLGQQKLSTPTKLEGLWRSVAAGQHFSVALDYLGRLAFWGRFDAFTRIDVPQLRGPDIYSKVVAGGEHYLAVRNDGMLYAGGNNDQGQSGFVELFNAFAIAAGRQHSLALTADCVLYAFGTNSHGQLALPRSAAMAPTRVDAVSPCVAEAPYLPPVSATVTAESVTEYQGRDLTRLPVVQISRRGDVTIPLEVLLEVGGTASNGVDYRLLPERVIIPGGASNATLTLRPIDDRLEEGDETIEVRVVPPTCLAEGSRRLDCYRPEVQDRVVVRLEDMESGLFALPQVTWIKPANGAVFLAPASVTLTAQLHDDNGWIHWLELFENDKPPQSLSIIREHPVPGETTTTSWFFHDLQPGFYSWQVRAVDNQYDTNYSAVLQVVVISSNAPLALLPLRTTATDGAMLRLQGQAGRPFFIQHSEDLNSWRLFTTNQFLGPPVDYLLELIRPRQFYRAFYGP
jgi:hypothetical protein